MGVVWRRRWVVLGIALCSLFGLCIVFTLNAITEDSAASQNEVFDEFKKRAVNTLYYGASVDGFKLVTDDNRTVIEAPWPETVRNLILCQKLKYDSLGPLPKASVIITFHNTETISSLLQTIHSILQRTPEVLIQEIIVIDDDSTKDDLGQILGIYLETVFPSKVRLYRNSVNMGLIRSRLKGSRLSQGEVIVFMDSHSEVQPGW